jgi:hypothetical protein
MTADTTPSKIAGLELAIEDDELDDRVGVLFHWPSTEQTPWTVRRLTGVPRTLAVELVDALAAPEHPDDAEATGPGGWLWPDGGTYANFADDAGDDYGFRFIDADGSELGPLSSRYVRQIADELDTETNDYRNPRRPNGAILLRRIADDYDRLLAGPPDELLELLEFVTGDDLGHWAECPAPPRPGCETCKGWFRARTRLRALVAAATAGTEADAGDPMDRLFAAGFFGVEVDSTEHVTPTRFTATCRDAAGVARHQAEGDTPRLALEALADLVTDPPTT